MLRARTRFRAPAQCPSLPSRRRGSGGVRRSNFNHDLSATRHYSVRSPELACSNQVTEYRERIGLRASGFDSDVQWGSDFSPWKQGYSVAAGSPTPLRSVCPAQPRTGITRRSATAREIKVRLRILTARVALQSHSGVCALCLPEPARDLIQPWRARLCAPRVQPQSASRYWQGSRSERDPSRQRIYPQRRRVQGLAY